jgi:uncharacterized protein YyaL (SSP411 family)
MGLDDACKRWQSVAPDNHPPCLDAAQRNVEFLFDKMFRDGLLLYPYKDHKAKLLGYLDDYAFFAVSQENVLTEYGVGIPTS